MRKLSSCELWLHKFLLSESAKHEKLRFKIGKPKTRGLDFLKLHFGKNLLFQGLRAQILGTILEPKSLVRENPKPLYNYRIMVFR